MYAIYTVTIILMITCQHVNIKERLILQPKSEVYEQSLKSVFEVLEPYNLA